MADDAVVRGIERYLFAGEDAKVIAILDGASVPDLPQMLHAAKAESICLFPGSLKPDVAAVAPYAVELRAGDAVTRRVLGAFGRHPGIFAVGGKRLRDLRNHLRYLLRVRTPEGKVVRFRYYDPRILRVYLPTCTPPEAKQFFGPVRFFAAEDEKPGRLLAFFRRPQGVRQEVVTLGPQ